ncbi:hypothetical protein JDV02_010549 [Purpureocillium takamizusanense]|uniref:F-box domain-containing protein n=1 Tax=Purpureocillium takamizusanense TaxID=2060973 RepID=A0A9Q8QSH6_9HYPO|nr:uncharacterized protein JDV02_010549 [Purpureocillium takamizusanense]UNI24833.1 hypothetical protein JDV02_010549 [Purpureocillium takamizusanense]
MAGSSSSIEKRLAEPASESPSRGITQRPPGVSPSLNPPTLPPGQRLSPPLPALSSVPSSDPPLITDVLPIVPTSVTTSPSNYGRINAENESNLSLFDDLPSRRARNPRLQSSPRSMSRDSQLSQGAGESTALQQRQKQAHHRQDLDMRRKRHRATPITLSALPPELVDAILSHLSAQELAFVAATCRALRKHAMSDFHWHRLVQHNVPGQAVTRPGPFSSYRELYVAHDRVWFLPKYKIWFCDRDLMGKLIVTRLDQRRGCIEGYQLLAVSNRSTFQHWSADSQVIIHGFEPQVKLHLDKPVVQFRVRDRQEDGGFSSRPGANRFADEMPMALEERMGAMFSNFLLTRPLDPKTAEEKLDTDYPYDNIWPPPTIPARHHVSGARSGQGVVELSPDDRPRSQWDVSDQTFRIRQWMEMAGTPAPPRLLGRTPAGPPDLGLTGVHIGEEIITYSTLDPVLYTPTPTKPWRGIWVGDYSGHGCEFLLINQPDDPPATDAELGLVRDDDETDESWEKRRTEARMYRGRFEAIKLTGDPNVPRGEYTFVADDLGPKGFVGVAADEPFVGARVVHSQGHIAGTGFVRDKYIESQLLLLSPDRLAQYWVGFGHISFFERVHIDDFLVP